MLNPHAKAFHFVHTYLRNSALVLCSLRLQPLRLIHTARALREVRESGQSPQLHEENKEQQRAALARGAAVDGTTTVPLGASKTQTETGDARI